MKLWNHDDAGCFAVLLKLAALACLAGCGTTVTWTGPDGSKAKMHLTGEMGVLTQETYEGGAGILGFGRSADGRLSRGRTFVQTQAAGGPVTIKAGADGITMTAATVSHAPSTRAGGNILQDTMANAAAASVVKTGISGLVDVSKVGIRAATE